MRSAMYTGRPARAITKRQRYQVMKGEMVTDRSTFDAHWRELGDWFYPRRIRFYKTDRNKGDKRNQNIIDSTARFSARTLQSGLHAGLTSPARPWFKLTTPDRDLAKRQNVKVWLEDVTQRMQVVLADGNLYNALPVIYADMGVFGTSAMAVVDDDEDLLRCYNYPVGSYALGLDARNKVASFVREFEMTVMQVVEQFAVDEHGDIDWENLSPTVKNLWDNSQYLSPVSVTWIVSPNVDYDRDRAALGRFKRWGSCYYEDGDDTGKFLRESGYDEFPFMCPRWEITGEDTYGTDCPGMTALGDNKQLQLQQKKKAQAIQKMVDPPLKGALELRTQKTSLLSGDITYLRDPDKGLQAIHEVRLDLSHLVEDMAQTQNRIQRAFYEDLFLMLARSDELGGAERPTAREVEERHEEKLIALGPVLERTDDELLNPLIDRVYAMMERKGLIPPAPQELEGVKLKVEYISILSQAMKLAGVAQQDRFLQSTIGLAETYPQVRHKVDVFRAVDNYQEMLGADPRLVRSDEEAQQLADQEAQQQQQAMAAEAAKNYGAAAKSAAGAQLQGGDSVLDRITQAAAGAAQGGAAA